MPVTGTPPFGITRMSAQSWHYRSVQPPRSSSTSGATCLLGKQQRLPTRLDGIPTPGNSARRRLLKAIHDAGANGVSPDEDRASIARQVAPQLAARVAILLPELGRVADQCHTRPLMPRRALTPDNLPSLRQERLNRAGHPGLSCGQREGHLAARGGPRTSLNYLNARGGVRCGGAAVRQVRRRSVPSERDGPVTSGAERTGRFEHRCLVCFRQGRRARTARRQRDEHQKVHEREQRMTYEPSPANGRPCCTPAHDIPLLEAKPESHGDESEPQSSPPKIESSQALADDDSALEWVGLSRGWGLLVTALESPQRTVD